MRLIIAPAKQMKVDTDTFPCSDLPAFLDRAELHYDCGIASLYSLVDENTSAGEATANAEEVYFHAAVRMFSQIKRDVA